MKHSDDCPTRVENRDPYVADCGCVGYRWTLGDVLFTALSHQTDCKKETAPVVATDAVNHPPHYTQHPAGVECVTVAEAFNFNLGNAIKYIWRAGLKGELLEDLKKARWYLDREIARLEKKA